MRRKGTPCACDCTDTCGNKVRKINGISPDPNGEFEIKAGNGIGISSGENSVTIINQAMASSFIAGNNIDITPVGNDLQISVTDDVSINNLNVAGDIIQQGAAYETHAEKVYTTNDYIYMRDGAVGGLAVGSLSGFEVIKYDGTNNGRLAIDKDGTARVGDVGDEQPLLTRDENSDLTDGHLLEWDATNFKAVDSGKQVSDFVEGSGNIGSNTKPIKIVDGVATPIDTVLVSTPTGNSQTVNGRLYFPSYDIVGAKQDVNRNDMHIDAYNPTTNTISRIVVTMRNDGVAQIILEKWNAALDANGYPYASTFISGTSIGTTS